MSPQHRRAPLWTLLTSCFILAIAYYKAIPDSGGLVSSLIRKIYPAYYVCSFCDDGCDPDGTRIPQVERVLPMLDRYDNSTFKEGEPIRWRNVSAINSRGRMVQAYNLEFDCSQIDEVCNNICYGVYCKTGISLALTVRRDDESLCRQARRNNACGSMDPNYCSVRYSTPFTAGYSCDEYPFASTKEGQTMTGAATRCVPELQNRKQGGRITAFYSNALGPKQKLPDGTGFTVQLMNTASSVNCASYNSNGTAPDCGKMGISGASQL